MMCSQALRPSLLGSSAAHLLTADWLTAPHHDVAPEVRPKQAALLLQRLDLHGLKLGTLQQ